MGGYTNSTRSLTMRTSGHTCVSFPIHSIFMLAHARSLLMSSFQIRLHRFSGQAEGGLLSVAVARNQMLAWGLSSRRTSSMSLRREHRVRALSPSIDSEVEYIPSLIISNRIVELLRLNTLVQIQVRIGNPLLPSSLPLLPALLSGRGRGWLPE